MKIGFLFFAVLLINLIGYGQFETLEKKNKFGLSFEGITIAKAKYDSINVADENIATAYKKSKTYYINSAGEVIFKGRTWKHDQFEDGIAIIKDKKGLYHLLNGSGEFMVGTTVGYRFQPYRVLDVVEFGLPGAGLFNHKGLAAHSYDSVGVYRDWLLIHRVHAESYIVKVKDDTKFFGRRKEKRYNYYHYFNVYNSNITELVAENVVDIEPVLSNFIFKLRDSTSQLIDAQGELLINDLSKVKSISQQYLQAYQDSQFVLIDAELGRINIKGNYIKYLIKGDYVHAFVTETDSTSLVDVYKNQELLQKDLPYFKTVDESHMLIKDSVGLYLVKNNGELINGPFSFLGEEHAGYILVCDSANYSYLDASDFSSLGFYYPLIETDVYRRKGPPKDALGAIFYGLFGGWLADGAHYIEIIDKGHDFYEGWAICAINKPSTPEPGQKRYMISSDDKLRYNYINNKNERLNAKKYKDCFPMYNGHAWVKERSVFSLIDTTGNAVGNYAFTDVELDRTGYFIVEKKGLKGLIGPDYQELLPCKYNELHSKSGSFYTGTGSSEELVYSP